MRVKRLLVLTHVMQGLIIVGMWAIMIASNPRNLINQLIKTAVKSLRMTFSL